MDGSTNVELEEMARKLRFKNFICVLMRDELTFRPKWNECGILNLNDKYGLGSHWVCWYKNGRDKIYFDSFGVRPRLELIAYLSTPMLYNRYQIQHYNDSNCGEWCLHVLNELNKGRDFFDIILNIVNDKQ